MLLGKILDVDLTRGRAITLDCSEVMARQYLGGRGFADRLLYDRLEPKADPLGPENVLLFCNGLLSGTQAPGSSRVHICAKSPQSGLLGFANIGGHFGAMLRSADVACLVIRGRARRPVYLLIDHEKVDIADAAFIWGCETWEAEDLLKAKLNDQTVAVVTIGPAGENLVPFSAIMHGRHDAAGRSGMGAVMGSKKLKAIAVRRRRLADTVGSNATATRAVKEYISHLKASHRFERYARYGVPQSLIGSNNMDALSIRNYQIASSKEPEQLSGERLHEYVTRPLSCFRCPVHCKGEVQIKRGKWAGSHGSRPEFETLTALGVKCGLYDLEAVIHLSNLCNLLGMDTVSTGGVVAFAMDLYDRKIISRQECSGLDLTWGNVQAMEDLIRQIAYRKGLGEILSKGVRKASETIGRGSERFAYHVKGVEMSAYDPRKLMGLGLGFAVGSRGPDFNNTYTVLETRWSAEEAERELGVAEAADRSTLAGKGVLLKRCMAVCAAIDCLGICKIPALSVVGAYDLREEAALATAISGLPVEPSSLMLVGERILHLERLLNLSFGGTANDDKLPPMFAERVPGDGHASGQGSLDWDSAVKTYYTVMGWDEAGVPTQRTIESFGLGFFGLRDPNGVCPK